jgi:hypothetical protein
MRPAFPVSDYYGSSAPPRPDQQAARSAGRRAAGRGEFSGGTGMVPTFTPEPFDGIGTQLCPSIFATATPQAFTVASRPATSPDPGVPLTTEVVRVRDATRPKSARLESVVFS